MNIAQEKDLCGVEVRFGRCPRAQPERCAGCSPADKARMALMLSRPYWQRRIERDRRLKAT